MPYTKAEWLDRVGNVLCLCPWHSAMFQFMEQQGEPIVSYVEELEDIVDSTADIGWGYHDALGDMFHEAFGGEK